MKPYIIASPMYDYTSGGIKVMWGLFGWLLAKGVEVYMNMLPKRRSPNDCIAIYPEIQNGNPVGTDKIIRYVLAPLGEMGAINQFGQFVPGPLVFGENEKVYYFSRLFGKTDDSHYLFLPVINLHIFKDYGKERNRVCFLVGKGKNQYKHPKNAIELSRTFAQDQKALADLLNECHTFYCYDKRTAMMEVARLCGCSVMYYGEHTKKELSLYEPGLNGIGFNGKRQKLDSKAFRKHYIGLIKEFETRLDTFLEETQKW